jgi:hypothetical protein
VGQSFLSVVLKKPSDGRGRKYKVWGEFYDRIFSGYSVEPYIISALIVRIASQWLKSQELIYHKDDIKRNIAKKGVYHISRIAAFLWRGSDTWRIDQKILKRQLAALEKDSSIIDSSFQEAFSLLESIARNDQHYLNDLDNALKSYTFDERIDRKLYHRRLTQKTFNFPQN